MVDFKLHVLRLGEEWISLRHSRSRQRLSLLTLDNDDVMLSRGEGVVTAQLKDLLKAVNCPVEPNLKTSHERLCIARTLIQARWEVTIRIVNVSV
jgi:hypothetical protein